MFLTIKLFTYAKLNRLKSNCFFCIKIDSALNNLQRLICHKPPNKQIKSLEGYSNSEIVFFYIFLTRKSFKKCF